MIALDARLAHWDTSEGRPFMGQLFNRARYEKNPSDLGCMCAQGQSLHLIGGWTVKMLMELGVQRKADLAVAKLFNISVAHSVLLRQINDSVPGAPSIVLTDPGKVLGDQWSKLLDFWWFCDQVDAAAWSAARAAARAAAGDAAWDAAWDAGRDAAWSAARAAARAAAWSAAGDAAGDAAWAAAGDAAWDAARAAAGDVVGIAAGEIQGAEIFHTVGRPFYFLPLFGITNPDNIPPRPSNYGDTTVNEGINHA